MKTEKNFSIFILILIILIYLPFIGLFKGAFIESTVTGKEFVLKWFEVLFEDQSFVESMENSFFVSVISALIAVILGFIISINLFFRKDKFAKIFDVLNLINLFLPEIIIAVFALLIFATLKLELGYISLITGHTILIVSFSMSLIQSKLNSIPEEIVLAAKDLGASDWDLTRRILWPLTFPAIMGSYFLCFMISFDDFLVSFFLSSSTTETLPLKLYYSMKLGLSPKLNALATLLFMFSIIIYMTIIKLRRKFIE